MKKNSTNSKQKNLTPKQRKFVSSIVKGDSKRKAGLIAGATTPLGADKYANRMSKNVQVNLAIQNALQANDMTPEYLVSKLKEVIEQDKEVGAKRLAIKDGLELQGWQRGERPNVTLDIKNATFFAQTRQQD